LLSFLTSYPHHNALAARRCDRRASWKQSDSSALCAESSVGCNYGRPSSPYFSWPNAFGRGRGHQGTFAGRRVQGVSAYARSSLVDAVTTPTLFTLGEQDFRTPLEQNLQMYDALQLRGTPTALLRAPGASLSSLRSRPSLKGPLTSCISRSA